MPHVQSTADERLFIQKKCSYVCDEYGGSFIDDTWCLVVLYCTITLFQLKLSMDFE